MGIVPDTQLELMGQMKAQEMAYLSVLGGSLDISCTRRCIQGASEDRVQGGLFQEVKQLRCLRWPRLPPRCLWVSHLTCLSEFAFV